MESSNFLRTVRVGGFDKKDVLNFVEDLNAKIHALEASLNEKSEALTALADSSVDTAQYDDMVSEKDEEISVLNEKIQRIQEENTSLKTKIDELNNEMDEKFKHFEDYKKQNARLDRELRELRETKSKSTSDIIAEKNALDLSKVFIEAQKSANLIIEQANETADRINSDAKKDAEKIVSDSKIKSESIIKSAEMQANQIITSAEDKSAEMRAAAEASKKVISDELADVDTNITNLTEVLKLFSDESLHRISSARKVLDDVQISLSKGEVPVVKKNEISSDQNQSTAKIAPVITPEIKASMPAKDVIPEKSYKKFGFDFNDFNNRTNESAASDNADSFDDDIKASDD